MPRNKRRESLLDFDRGADWEPPFQREARERKLLEEKRAQEEALRRRWDNAQGGVQTTEAPGQEPAAQQQNGLWANANDPISKIIAASPVLRSVGSNLAASTQGLWGGVNRMDADFTRRAAEISRDPSQISGMGDALVAGLTGPISGLASSAGWERWADSADARADAANAAAESRGKKAQQSIDEIDWWGGQTIAKSLGAVSNPQSLSSFAPVVGAPLSAVLGYPASYNELRLSGATPSEAARGALPAALAEYAGGKVGDALHIPVGELANTKVRAAVKAATEIGKETVGEDITSILQSGNYAAIASATDNKDLAEYANRRAGEWGQDLWENTVGSLILGGAASTPQAAWQYASEQGALQQKQTALRNAALQQERERADKRRSGALDQAIIDAGNTALSPAIPAGPLPEGANLTRPIDAAASVRGMVDTQSIQQSPEDVAQNAMITSPVGATPVTQLRDASTTFTPAAPFNAEAFGRLQANPEPDTQPAAEPQSDEDIDQLDDAERSIPVSQLRDALGTVQEDMPAEEAAAPQPEPAGLTPVEVIDALSAKRGSRDSNIATELLHRNKVKIVQDASEIPGGATPIGTAGWYDGNNTYVVSSALDKDNILPSLMSVMGHEVKHGVDASGYEHVLGKTANDALVTQATNLVKSGDQRAIDAYRKATGQTDWDEAKNDWAQPLQIKDKLSEVEQRELVSYSINNAMDDNRGGWGAIKRTAAAAWRNKARDLGISKADVKIDDLRYLTKGMLESVALSERGLEGQLPEGADGQAMTISGGTSAAEQLKNNRTWLSADGKRKYEISDRDSSVEVPSDYVGRVFRVDEVLKHPKLYKELPDIGATTISFEPLPEGVGADYDIDDKHIRVNTKDPAFLTGGRNKFDGAVHRYIIHEMQHAAQGISGSTNGASPNDFLSKDDLKLRKMAEDYRDSVAAARAIGTPDSEIQNIISEADQAQAKYDAAYEVAVRKYKSVLGELEAYRAMGGIPFTEEELDASGVGQQETTWADRGGIVSSRGKLLKSPQQKKAASMAETSNDGEDLALPLSHDRMSPEVVAAVQQLKDGYINGDISFEDYMAGLEPLVQRAITEDSSSKRAKGMAQIVTPRDRARASASTASLRDKANELTNKDGMFADVYRRFARTVYGDRGYGKELNEIGLSLGKEAAALSVKGAQLDSELEEAINAAAGGRNADQSAVNAEIDRVVEAANASSSPAQRKSLIAALDRKYPGSMLGTKLNDIRENNWKMAKKLIEYRINDSRPLTKKELATYKKMIDEQERWTTRVYQSQMRHKKLYADTFMARAKDANSKEAKSLKEAIDVLKANYLSIPPKKLLEELPVWKLQELYKAWDIGGSRELEEAPDLKDSLVKKLDFLRTVSGEKLDAKAMEIAQDLIRGKDGSSSGANMIRGMRQNRTVLETRNKIPQQLRTIMGEVTDPRLRLALSTARLVQVGSQTRALTDIYTQGEGVWWSSEKTDKFSTPVSSQAFGPLDGKYVSEDVSHMLGAYVEAGRGADESMQALLSEPGKAAGSALAKVGSLWHETAKWGKFVAIPSNAATMLMNLAGSPLTLLKNGAFNPKLAVKAMADTAAMLSTTTMRNASPERMAKNQELIRAGVADSAIAHGLRSGEWEYVANALKDANTDSALRQGARNASNIFKKGKSTIGTAYAFMDMWTKTATYYANKAAEDAYNKAESASPNYKPMTEEQIVREAGHDTTMSTISYEHASPLVQAIEKNLPFGGAFAVYTGETWRSTFGGLQVASKWYRKAQDATTPEGKRIAVTRMLQQIGGTLGATAGVTAATLTALGREDENDKKKRPLFAEWDKDKVHVYLGRDEKGREHYAPVNRLDPIGPVNEPMVSFIRAIQQDGGVGEATGAALKNFGATLAMTRSLSRLTSDLWAEATGGKVPKQGKDSALARAMPGLKESLETYGSYGNIGVNALAVLDSTIPSIATRRIDPENLNVKGDGEALAEWLKKLGYKSTVVDPNKSMDFRAGDYTAGIKKLSTTRDKLLAATSNPEAVKDKMLQLIDEERELFDTLHAASVGYREFHRPAYLDGIEQPKGGKLGVNDAYAALKDGGVPKKNIGNILQGTFVPTVVDDKLISKWAKLRIKALDRADPKYAEKLEDINSKAELLRSSLRLDGSEQ